MHLHNCSICCSNVGGRVKPLSASCCSDIHLSRPELQLLTRLLSSSRSKTGLKGNRKAWDGTLASAMRLAITTCEQSSSWLYGIGAVETSSKPATRRTTNKTAQAPLLQSTNNVSPTMTGPCLRLSLLTCTPASFADTAPTSSREIEGQLLV